MPEREYEITIAADGTVELNIHGHKGKSCLNSKYSPEQNVVLRSCESQPQAGKSRKRCQLPGCVAYAHLCIF